MTSKNAMGPLKKHVEAGGLGVSEPEGEAAGFRQWAFKIKILEGACWITRFVLGFEWGTQAIRKVISDAERKGGRPFPLLFWSHTLQLLATW